MLESESIFEHVYMYKYCRFVCLCVWKGYAVLKQGLKQPHVVGQLFTKVFKMEGKAASVELST